MPASPQLACDLPPKSPGATVVPPTAELLASWQFATKKRELAMQHHRPKRRGRAGLMLVVLAACAALALGAASTGGAKPSAGGLPDTYVSYWDSVGSQAFTASGLTAVEGHVIFGYVAVAVYDSVMAIEGGYEPFANDVDAPAGASAQAAVAAAAHRVLEHYLPAQEASIVDPAYTASLATIADGQAKTTGVALGEAVAGLSSPSGRTTASARRLALRPAEPPGRGCLDPDRPNAPRALSQAHGSVRTRSRRISSGRSAHPRSTASSGRRSSTR